MLIFERHARLQDYIARAGVADLETISRELGVSQSTVRRDIEALEKRGIVRRTHGGVIWTGERERTGESQTYVFQQRMTVLEPHKRRIARAAAKLVEPRQTILIDGGTTTYYLAHELHGKAIQIVTNSLPIADVFLDAQDVELILTGGVLFPRYGTLLGPIADQSLAAVHTSIMFFSVAGINQGSLFNQNLLMVQNQRKMMEQSQKIVLLADSSKFGQQALARLGSLDEVDIVISDDALAETHRNEIQNADCQLIIAPAE